MDPCRVCGARLYEGATFCARCHAPVQASDGEIAELLREVDAAGGQWQQPHTPATRWRPHERYVAPQPMGHVSRWRGGALTFGPLGRIAITIAVVLVPVVAWQILPLFALEFVLVWSVVVGPLVLRDVWRPSRTR